MTTQRIAFLATLAAVLLGTTTFAMAQAVADEPAAHSMGEHPAILVKRQGPQLDTNRFILAHPAGLQVVEAPSPTYDHPAVVVARRAGQDSDLERYLAQPPVASAWLRRSETSVAANPAALSR